MFKYVLIISTFFSLNAVANNQCSDQAKHLKATYSVTSAGESSDKSTSELVLWRNNNSVAHQYPAINITQTWTLVRNKFIKPVRYFDAHERAIEYQPGERIHGHTERDFSYRYQLISNDLLEKMTLLSTSENGCYSAQVFTLNTPSATMSLTWLPELLLIKKFEVNKNNVTQQWQLQNVSFNADTDAFFSIRDTYQSTDYADIGDDHTDPFLTKMVTQGFIEPAASGIYDHHGTPLKGSTHSH